MKVPNLLITKTYNKFYLFSDWLENNQILFVFGIT